MYCNRFKMWLFLSNIRQNSNSSVSSKLGNIRRELIILSVYPGNAVGYKLFCLHVC